MSHLTAVSLFAGAVDGLAIAFEQAGFTITHHVEWDEWCCNVLEKNFPDSIVINKDVTNVDGKQFAGTDVIMGGPPCQGFSLAGNRLGLLDDRYLWPAMLAIIRAARPRAALVENVSGSISGGLVDAVCTDLEAEGYDCSSFHVPASAFGAPHERYRVFIIGILADTQRQRYDRTPAITNTSNDAKWHNQAPERNRTAVIHENVTSSETVVNTAEPRLAHWQPTEQPANQTETASGLQSQRKRPGSSMVNTRSTGRKKPHATRQPARTRHTARRHHQKRSRRVSQSRLGRTPDGTARRVDIASFPGWPAGQGVYQHHYEPPRTTTRKTQDHKRRIQALGNAVVWQQAYPIARALVAWLQTQDEATG